MQPIVSVFGVIAIISVMITLTASGEWLKIKFLFKVIFNFTTFAERSSEFNVNLFLFN